MTEYGNQHYPENSKELQTDDKSIKSVYEWVEAAVFSMICVSIVFMFLFRIVGVDGDSMFPTLYNYDRLVISRFNYTPQRGDIVIINRYREEPLVKRVIAIGGDTLEINGETNQVIVNGKELEEPYVFGITQPLGFEPNKQDVPDGYIFVMGDNRQNSKDSRDSLEVGFIKQTDIMGKAVFRFFPLSRAGRLD